MNKKIKPKISVITVCFNAIIDIESTIISVLNQTYNNIEYIIIDGGSSDGTIEIIRKYENRISFWVSESDKGIYDAMNKGIAIAKGEWVNMMNAGDIFESNYVLEEVFNISYSDSIKFLYSDNYYVNKMGVRRLSINSHLRMSLIHQSSIYLRTLHNIHGIYIVTPKIIISDNLFFNSLPEEYFQKINTVISVNTDNGISAKGMWCGVQYLCASVIFRRITILQFFIAYFKLIIKKLLLK